MTEHLEAGMQAIAAVIAQTTGKDIGRIPGSGAAGGVGGAFLAFTNARLMSGIDLILTHLQFGKRIQNADLIITGEGSADAQTTMGKVAYGILREARKQKHSGPSGSRPYCRYPFLVYRRIQWHIFHRPGSGDSGKIHASRICRYPPATADHSDLQAITSFQGLI